MFEGWSRRNNLPIRDRIQEAKKELGALWYDIEDTVCYLDSFEYLMRGLMVQKMKEVRPPKRKGVVDEGSQTFPQPAAILRDLEERVNSDELGATVQGIRETRSKDLLVELKCSTKSRGRLDTAFKEAVVARGTVRHLISGIEVEIADLEPTTGAEDVEDAVRSYFDQGAELELRVSLSETPYRGNRKSNVLLEEARALKLLKGAHIKMGWVSYRVRRKKEALAT